MFQNMSVNNCFCFFVFCFGFYIPTPSFIETFTFYNIYYWLLNGAEIACIWRYNFYRKTEIRNNQLLGLSDRYVAVSRIPVYTYV